MIRVDRTCTEARSAGDDKARESESRPLKEYRQAPAYVLLGDPGAGKTTAFEMECEALADGACLVDARDFIAFDPEDHPEWCGKTLFIDALDEVRAGGGDARTPFDAIRGRLEKLGRPRFRLSCREADWLGENDRTRLASVTPQDSPVTVLHLDPLKRADAERILAARADIADSYWFVTDAGARGVDALLEYPLTLHLLADVVSREGRWPRSRQELFDQASVLLTTEYNEEHRSAEPQPPASELLDAAGRLCSLLLVTGASGYTLRHGPATAEYPEVSQCEYKDRQLLRRVLATRLFAARAEGRFVPIHRHVAEFVGAKHLARVIGEGLPASRVVALLTGYDGGVVTSLRGIAAWLATLSMGARLDLLERDPIGVALYGDAQGFSMEHRRALFRALIREASQLNSEIWHATLAGTITSPDMEPELRALLESRDQVDQAQLEFVLDALGHGPRLAGLADDLFRILYEDDHLSLKRLAMAAFVHHCADEGGLTAKLAQLLTDISANKVQDWDDELAAAALRRLYPGTIPPAKIWDHLTDSAGQRAADYHHFWSNDLMELSTDAEIAELLDQLANRGQSLAAALASRDLEMVPADLLARGVKVWGDTVGHSRLLSWLGVGRFRGAVLGSNDPRTRVANWLQERPEVQRKIVAEYVSTGRVLTNRKVAELLFGSPLPSDFGFWCLDQAADTADRPTARNYLRYARDHGVPLDVLLDRARASETLRDEIGEVLVCRLPPSYFDDLHPGQEFLKESHRRYRDFIAAVRSNVDALHENRCPVGLLHELALAHFGLTSDVEGTDPLARITDLLDNDEQLIEATRVGFRRTPFREDIPNIREIVGLVKSGRMYLVALPFLAGVDELDDLRVLSARQLRQALAFHFCASVEDRLDRERRLLELDHEAGADVFIKCITARMRKGDYAAHLAQRLTTEDYAPLARQAALPLLRAFPVHCSQSVQLSMLDGLLVAALRTADRAGLADLIARKQSSTSMSVSQRVHWMAAAVIAVGENYCDRLWRFVQSRDRRVTQLSEFLFAADSLLAGSAVPTLACFIRLLAPSTQLPARKDWLRVGRYAQASRSVHRMIIALANHDGADSETLESLDQLATNPTLGEWRHSLAVARDRAAGDAT